MTIIATLRSVGGSVVLSIPKKLLDLINLKSGQRVEIDINQDKLIISPTKKKQYSLEELINQKWSISDNNQI